MLFLATCRDFVGHSVGRDPRIDYLGSIVPLSRQLAEFIDQWNFFQIVRVSCFDDRMSYIPYSRKQEV